MAIADHRLDLIRLRAKYVARLEKRLKFTRDAYRDALGEIDETLGTYELEDLSPDQDPRAVLDEIRRLAKRRLDLESNRVAETKALAEGLDGARGKLTAAIFDDQLELFPALEADRKAAEAEAEPVRLRVGEDGHPTPLVEPEVDASKRPTRGKRKPPPRLVAPHDPDTGEILEGGA